jgi:plastocyanin
MAVLAAALLLALVVAGCGGGGSNESAKEAGTTTAEESGTTTAEEGGTTTIAGVAAADHGTKDASGKDELDVELDDNYFEPTVITGTPGQKLKLELENEGSAEHNFTLTAQSVDQDVEAGEKADVTVTIPQSGQVSFFCKYHKALGMAGALATS